MAERKILFCSYTDRDFGEIRIASQTSTSSKEAEIVKMKYGKSYESVLDSATSYDAAKSKYLYTKIDKLVELYEKVEALKKRIEQRKLKVIRLPEGVGIPAIIEVTYPGESGKIKIEKIRIRPEVFSRLMEKALQDGRFNK